MGCKKRLDYALNTFRQLPAKHYIALLFMLMKRRRLSYKQTFLIGFSRFFLLPTPTLQLFISLTPYTYVCTMYGFESTMNISSKRMANGWRLLSRVNTVIPRKKLCKIHRKTIIPCPQNSFTQTFNLLQNCSTVNVNSTINCIYIASFPTSSMRVRLFN